MSDFLTDRKFKLGFGLMRLPKLEDGSIDIPQVSEMADRFIEAGGTYFDTAYVYDNGASEAAFKAAVTDRYPREAYTLCTKINAFMMCHDEESCKQEFQTSLERTGAGYFDYYLIHAIQRSNYQTYTDYHIWEYVKEMKEKGLIRHWGISFHADPEFLEKVLTEHPDIEFVQLQINYADWENPGVAARRNWEICKAHGKPVAVMEPVKGGILADPIPTVKAVFDEAAADGICAAYAGGAVSGENAVPSYASGAVSGENAVPSYASWAVSGENAVPSYASWAVRYAASLDNIFIVLSGMSSLEQMENNLSYMQNFQPLTAAEQEVIGKAQQALNEDKSIPCTSCHYCTDGCPMNIPIPDIFTVANRSKGSPKFRIVREYTIVTREKGKASECIECGQCEGACPQQLPIMSLLKKCRDMETV